MGSGPQQHPPPPPKHGDEWSALRVVVMVVVVVVVVVVTHQAAHAGPQERWGVQGPKRSRAPFTHWSVGKAHCGDPWAWERRHRSIPKGIPPAVVREPQSGAVRPRGHAH